MILIFIMLQHHIFWKMRKLSMSHLPLVTTLGPNPAKFYSPKGWRLLEISRSSPMQWALCKKSLVSSLMQPGAKLGFRILVLPCPIWNKINWHAGHSFPSIRVTEQSIGCFEVFLLGAEELDFVDNSPESQFPSHNVAV